MKTSWYPRSNLTPVLENPKTLLYLRSSIQAILLVPVLAIRAARGNNKNIEIMIKEMMNYIIKMDNTLTKMDTAFTKIEAAFSSHEIKSKRETKSFWDNFHH